MGNFYSWIVLAVASLSIAVPGHAQEYVPGEVIVKFKSDVPQGKFSSKAGSSLQAKRSWTRLNLHQFQSKAGGQNVELLVQQLRQDPNVEYAEPNYILRAQNIGQASKVMSIPDFRQQFVNPISGMNQAHYSQSTADIGVDEAWQNMTPNTAHVPVVAVIDSGVDYNHNVFRATGAMWVNQGEIPNDGIDNDGNGYVDDIYGWNFADNNKNPMDLNNHGTHVAGIVLGVTQDITLPQHMLEPAKIRIMALKFLGTDGAGSTADAIEAIDYAVANGASVINASWGGGGYSHALLNSIVSAYNAKVSFIAAAGNSKLNNDSAPTYPANYDVPNVVSIAATKDNDFLASFSNFGKNTVHLASPGDYIWSTLPNNGWGEFSGTSMAAPLVAGLVALMEREMGQPLSGYQARRVLLDQGSRYVGNVSGKVVSDARVHVFKALDFVMNNDVSTDQPAYGANRALASSGSAAGGCGLVKSFMRSGGGGGASMGGGDFMGRTLLLLIVMSPFVFALALKQQRKDGSERRAFDRYNISSEVRIQVGDKELVGAVSCISLGGVKIDTDALLENGGIVEMNIMSPDGKEKIQVSGKVVWSAERKAYGVQFCEVAEAQSSLIRRWTQNLVKAS